MIGPVITHAVTTHRATKPKSTQEWDSKRLCLVVHWAKLSPRAILLATDQILAAIPRRSLSCRCSAVPAAFKVDQKRLTPLIDTITASRLKNRKKPFSNQCGKCAEYEYTMGSPVCTGMFSARAMGSRSTRASHNRRAGPMKISGMNFL